ncbi:MAG: acetyltransferase [Alphaproteobacteria bacterium]|nr:acetyltransferase [Alphaproteobacteria bacterium]
MADIVIFGASPSAEVAKTYLEAHSSHRIVGFTVDDRYATREQFCGLPLVPWDRLEQFFPPSQVQLLGPISYRRMNEFRRDRYLEGKERSYRFASFIHPNSQIYTDDIGEHCFILEANVVQPHVKIGNNVILWGANWIGHHCVIGDHCFFSSQIGIAGGTRIGERCFVGGQAGVIEGLTIGDACLLSAGVFVSRDIPAGSVVRRGSVDKIAPFPSSRMRGLL